MKGTHDLPTPDLQTAVRRELSLEAPTRPRRRSPLFGLVAATTLLSALAAGPVAAQGPYQQDVISGFSSLDAGDNSTPVLVDLDGDGDLDAVVGVTYGVLRYFKNTGSSSVPAFVNKTGSANPFDGIDVGFNSSPELVDLDDDGDLDAVVGEFLGGLRYFEYTGGSSLPAFVERTGSASPFDGIDVGFRSSPQLVDLDGDGDLDAVVGEFYGGLFYFENTGGSSLPAFVERTGSANPFDGIIEGAYTSYTTAELVDLDGDGDLDVVFGEFFGRLLFLKNIGSSSVPAFIVGTGSLNPFDGIDVGDRSTPDLEDLDSDGDLDAVVGEVAGGLLYFKNTGNSSVPAFVEGAGSANPFVGIDVGSYSSPEFVDLDGDGDLDAVIGENYGSLRYFRNTGSLSALAFVEATGGANPFDDIDLGTYSSPALADLDGDGDLDAVVGEHYGSLRYFKNTGISGMAAFVEGIGSGNPFDGIDVGFRSRPELVDLDGDGNLDLVVGELYGSLRFFRNTGISSIPAFVERTGSANPLGSIDVGVQSSPELVDLDGDGDFDALVGALKLLFFKNTGSSSVPAFVEVTGSANPLASIDVGIGNRPELVDLDGDGDLDCLVGEYGGRVVFFRSMNALFADGFESGDTSAWSLTVP